MNAIPAFVDCHIHILPGIDDGAKDLEMSLAMARLAARHGTRAVIATPHHLAGSFRNSRADILSAINLFHDALRSDGVDLDLYPGSELHLTDDLPSRIMEGDAMTFNNQGKHALVELPAHTIPVGTEYILEQIIYGGCTPVIAHPERNSQLCEQPDRALDWVSWGCCLQLTAQSIAGDFGGKIQAVSRDFIRRGQVHLVGSDAHRAQGRSPDLQRGYTTLKNWVGEEGADLLTVINPGKLLTGETLSPITPAPDSRKPRQGLWSKIFSR